MGLASSLFSAGQWQAPKIYMWWKKTVSKEEVGQALWQLCCNFAEDFCINLRPKLQAEGFLRDPAKERVFMEESIVVHFWIIWSVLNTDRAVLDVLNNFFNNWDIDQNQARVSERLQERFQLYIEAVSKDKELHARGLPPTEFACTALQCLLNDGKPIERNIGIFILTEVDSRLSSTFPAVRKFREELKIRGA